MRSLLYVLILAIGGCTWPACNNPTPKPPPGEVTVTGLAFCQHLAAIGCPQPAGCAETFDLNNGRVIFNSACIMAAGSPVEAEACKSVECR